MNKSNRITNPLQWASLMMLAAVMAGCGSSSSSSDPISGAGSAVDLVSADGFAILSKAGIVNTDGTAITGNIGTSPITSQTMSTILCSEITPGIIYGIDAGYDPVGAIKTCFKGSGSDITLTENAIADMETAYTQTAGRVDPDFTELHSGLIGGKTLAPGLYKWATGVSIATATDVTLDGSATDIWIFQIAGDFVQEFDTNVTMSGGAIAKNVFWQVAGGAGAAIAASAHFEGTLLAATTISVGAGSTVTGRLFSQTDVTLQDTTVVTKP
jgi:hypothetical protein